MPDIPKTTPAPAAAASFDICDPRNRYEPCPQCSSASGMGMTSGAFPKEGKGPPLVHKQFVLCTMCDHVGPAFEFPPEGSAFDPNNHPALELDRKCFEAWNEASRKSRKDVN